MHWKGVNNILLGIQKVIRNTWYNPLHKPSRKAKCMITKCSLVIKTNLHLNVMSATY